MWPDSNFTCTKLNVRSTEQFKFDMPAVECRLGKVPIESPRELKGKLSLVTVQKN